MVTIVITPKLGPHGSGIESVGVEVTVRFTEMEANMSRELWEGYKLKFEKPIEITFDQDGKPSAHNSVSLE